MSFSLSGSGSCPRSCCHLRGYTHLYGETWLCTQFSTRSSCPAAILHIVLSIRWSRSRDIRGWGGLRLEETRCALGYFIHLGPHLRLAPISSTSYANEPRLSDSNLAGYLYLASICLCLASSTHRAPRNSCSYTNYFLLLDSRASSSNRLPG